ncbi:hypothetical protein [Aequorivita sp. CIP111184]|uniref:hypothetical protein n=1 Tax=Aequorivita sp. CIP111184 TaxID=2211356 RepID=UPI000DBBBBAC|nr:hypothetical protein [Aequorivita sp. CIP111184]SRX56081.1 hypothetical protein AEQU1_03108 [Aequorivita sp. CIP111184]
MSFKRSVLLAFTVICFFQNSFCQDIKVATLSLKPEKSEAIEGVNFYVENIIDNRFSKSYLGIVQIGFNNTRTPLVFEQSFSKELKDYFDVIFPNKTTSKPITIRIDELKISENPENFTEEGKAKVVLEVLKPKGNNMYELLGRYSSVSIKTTIDATGSHSKRIQDVLKESLLSFFKENPNFESKGMLNLQSEPNGTPILKEPIQKGFFYTFFELQHNRAINDDKVVITKPEERNKTDKLIIKKEDGLPSNYMAYYDGSNIYVNSNLYSSEDYFVKTYKIDNFLLFNEKFLKDISYLNDLSIVLGKSEFPYMQARNCFILDLSTGIFHGITKDKMKILLDEKFPDLYKLYKRYGQKDDEKVFDILKELFEKENPERIREILAPKFLNN